MTTHCIPDRTNFLRGYAAAKAEMAQKKSKKPRNYNATELTLINLHAIKKQLQPLELRVRNLEAALRLLLRKVK